MRVETDTAADEAPRHPAVLMLNGIAEVVLVIAVLGELFAVVLNVAARVVLGVSFLWTEEIARIALSTLAFVGGTVAYQRGDHTHVRAVIDLLPLHVHRRCVALADTLVLLIAVVALLSSFELLALNWQQTTPILGWPVSNFAIPLTASMALLAFYAIERLWRDHRPSALGVIILVIAIGLAAYTTQSVWRPWAGGDVPIMLALAFFFLAVVVGVPVGFALLLSTASYLWISDVAPIEALPQQMVNGTSNFILLAIPFFILAGLIMERGGISLRLVRFVHAFVGHLRGGLLQVMVLSMYLVSGLSGSKAADVAAVGTVMRGMLRKQGYSNAEGAAVLAASAVMGETVPPSIAMLILGSVTSISMAGLFIGGIIPAAVIAVCLMILIYVRARRSGMTPEVRAPWSVRLNASIGALLPFLMPVILFVGILGGIATPTEVSAFAVLYGMFLSLVVYREMDLRSFFRTAVDSVALAGMILFILAAASGFSWALTIAYIPQRVVDLLHGFNDSKDIFLIGSLILLIIGGSLLEGLPALNILAPLLIPIAGKIGISELHYGMMLIIAMGVGAFLPPAGVGFYVCCAVAQAKLEAASRAMVPYLIVLLIGLLLVTFVPWFTLVLPHYFGFRG
ncbi:MAG TPA: TRAP transporter large permease subunit [Pseudolabrys sp.]|nr:TRAP transporter large permease subunit [Pseudolabrys sp.]